MNCGGLRIAVLLCCSGVALAQTGTITGVVTLPDTSYHGEIVVTVLGQNTSAITQANGSFVIPNVVAGSVSVQAGKLYYVNTRVDTVLSPGGTLNLSLSLSNVVFDTMLTHLTSRIVTSATNTGNVGALNHFVEPGDPGFSWNGQQQLFEASLMMGVSTTRVSDAARFIFGVAQDNLDQDFLSLSDLVIRTHGDDSTTLHTAYDDSRANLPPGTPSQPLGIRVVQQSHSFGDSLNTGYLLIKLILTNTTTVTLNNLLVGWFIDWDVGADTANRGKIISMQNIIPGINGGNPFDAEVAYQWNGPLGMPYAGVIPLSQPKFRAARIASNRKEIFVGAPNGGLTEANKYLYMRSRRDTARYGDHGVQEDLSMIVSLGGLNTASYDSSFFSLPPQSSVVVGFAFVGGYDSAQIVSNALQAQKKWVQLGQEIAGLPGEPQFSTNRSMIDFGEVGVGASRTDSVIVTNAGTASLVVGSSSSTNAQFAVTPPTATIAPTESRKFFITFSPTSIGLHDGQVVFTHNAATTPDTLFVTGIGRAEIGGTYFVGAAHQLQTLKDVADLLNFGQLIAPAVFLLTDAAYADSLLDLTAVNGSSPQNTVTLRPAPGVNTVLTLRGNTTLPVGMRFTEVSNFTIDGWNGTSPQPARNMTINIDTTAPTNTTGILIRGTTKNFTVMNAVVKGYRTSTDGAPAILVDTVGGVEVPDSNLLFSNLAVSRAQDGIVIRGMAIPNQHRQIIVRGSLFGGAGNQSVVRSGLSLSHCDGGEIHDNIVNGVNTSGFSDTLSAVGFNLDGQNTNVRVYNNKVSNIIQGNAGAGVAIGIRAAGQSGTPSRYKIWNNMVWNVRAPVSTDASNFGGPLQGISLPGAMYDSVYYNSVWISGTSTSSNHSSALYIVGPTASESTKTTLWNNIFVNTSSMGMPGRNVVVKLFDAHGGTYSTADRNDYLPDGIVGALAAVGPLSTNPVFLSTLSEFRARTGRDANSISLDPQFDPLNPLSIRTNRATPVESKAFPIAGVTTDIDGDGRDATSPDIGADEGLFVPSSLRSVRAVFDSVNRKIILAWGESCCGSGYIAFNSNLGNFSATGTYDPGQTTGQMVGALRLQQSGHDELQVLGFDMTSPTNMKLVVLDFLRQGILTVGTYSITSGEASFLYFPNYNPSDTTTWDDVYVLLNGSATMTSLTASTATGSYTGSGLHLQTFQPITVYIGSFNVNYATTTFAEHSVRNSSRSLWKGILGVDKAARLMPLFSDSPAKSNTLTGYNLYRAVNTSPFVLFDSVHATASSYTDTAIGPQAATYRYYLRARYNNGVSAPSETASVAVPPILGLGDNEVLPTVFSLEQNYPNPFNPVTIIRYALPAASYVTLRLYNLLGQEISRLVEGVQEGGYWRVPWDGRDSRGISIPSGMYLYRIEAKPLGGGNPFLYTRKMLHIK